VGEGRLKKVEGAGAVGLALARVHLTIGGSGHLLWGWNVNRPQWRFVLCWPTKGTFWFKKSEQLLCESYSKRSKRRFLRVKVRDYEECETHSSQRLQSLRLGTMCEPQSRQWRFGKSWCSALG